MNRKGRVCASPHIHAVRQDRWSISRSPFRHILVLFLIVLFTLVSKGERSGRGLPILNRVSQLRRLTPDQAKKGYPVRIRGVVTYYDLAHGDFFVQDATGAMYILPPAGLAVRAGQYVEVEGISRVAEFASEVFEARIRVLSERRLPPPLGVSAEELASGAYDCQRIEVEGVVRAANSYQGGLSLDVTAGAVQFKAYVPNTTLVPAELVDARVHIRGTCGGFYNRKDQFIALQVMVPTLADIRIAEPAPGNQFTAQAQSIRSILRATPNRGYRHRVRVQGVVTLQRLGRSLFIRDDSVGLLVKTRQLTALHVGDRVDVAGFPALGDYAPILQDAIFQRIGASAPLVPVTVTAPEAWLGSFDAELIRISARLIESSQGSGQRSLVLEAGNINFRAEIEEAAGRKLAGLENGSLLQLTGICSVQVDENRAASSFLLLLRSAGGVVVLPPDPDEPNAIRLGRSSMSVAARTEPPQLRNSR